MHASSTQSLEENSHTLADHVVESDWDHHELVATERGLFGQEFNLDGTALLLRNSENTSWRSWRNAAGESDSFLMAARLM